MERGERRPLASSRQLAIGGATIQLDIAQGPLDLPPAAIVQWVQKAATAVTEYYGHFPVPRVRVLIVPVADREGVLQGTTWGGRDGFSSMSRLRLGEHTTQKDLDQDWTMTHELVHSAFPDLPRYQHWMEEGLATYVEPIARAQVGQLSAKQVWGGVVRDMAKGEPGPGDEGLDRTHTWGRTYWGGAMFCLVADVTIRRETGNRKGLQDALRAIVDAGGTIDKEWPLARTLQIGDKATGTTVLTDLYQKWSDTPTSVDLDKLWAELGIRRGASGIAFDSAAPLAKIREAITKPEPPSSQQ